MQPATGARPTMEVWVPRSDAEVLETLLARVMRLVAAHWSSSNWSPVNGTKRIAATCSSASDLQELR
jgi:hypothetical protein